MPDAEALLAAYDAQLRGEPEVRAAQRTIEHDRLTIGVFAGGYGYVTYRDLDGADQSAVRALVQDAARIFDNDPSITSGEWKTRGHDRIPGLHDALVAARFEPQARESIMIGSAALLAVDVPLPDEVELHRIEDPDQVRAASAMADRVFGDAVSDERAAELIERIMRGSELWAATTGGVIVSTGRLDPVTGTEFAGVWGGATRPQWRGRGIYRALTAERARSAMRLGARYITSDSTEFSRPILERAGLLRVSTTTPYVWRRRGE